MGCVLNDTVIKWACLLAPSPKPLKYDTFCLMGCVLNNTAIKWACPPQPIKHDTSCLMGCVLNNTAIKWACLLAPSPKTLKVWYLLSIGLYFERYCNQVGMSASTIPPDLWNMILLVCIFASTIPIPEAPMKHDTSCLMGSVLNNTAIKWACVLAPSPPPKPLKHDTS